MFRLALAMTLALGVAAGPSIRNCGQATDHFQATEVSITPDPPVHGQPFTVKVLGSLDADVAEGQMLSDMKMTVMGTATLTNTTSQFSHSPTMFNKGAFDFVMGPWTPPANVPGSATVQGTTRVVNLQGEPIMCLEFDMEMPLMLGTGMLGMFNAGTRSFLTGAAETCTTPSDHMANMKSSTTGNTTTTSWTLDEDLSKVTLDVDVTVTELFLRIPIVTSVPIEITPGFAKGDFTMVEQDVPREGALAAGVGVTLDGAVKVHDDKGEQVTCAVVHGTGDEVTITV